MSFASCIYDSCQSLILIAYSLFKFYFCVHKVGFFTSIVDINQTCDSLGISQTTSQTTSTGVSRGSNVSGNSRFSASSGDESYPNGQILPTPNLRIFTFLELRAATRNFKSDTVLGEGGFGKVFKGWLDEKAPGKSGSGTVIAVKKLNSESLQGFEEWQVS